MMGNQRKTAWVLMNETFPGALWLSGLESPLRADALQVKVGEDKGDSFYPAQTSKIKLLITPILLSALLQISRHYPLAPPTSHLMVSQTAFTYSHGGIALSHLLWSKLRQSSLLFLPVHRYCSRSDCCISSYLTSWQKINSCYFICLKRQVPSDICIFFTLMKPQPAVF